MIRQGKKAVCGLVMAIAASAAHAQLGTVSFSASATGASGVQDLSSQTYAFRQFDVPLGVTRRDIFSVEEYWQPITAQPFQDANGQWFVTQEGSRLTRGDEWTLFAPSIDLSFLDARASAASGEGWSSLEVTKTTSDPAQELRLNVWGTAQPTVWLDGVSLALMPKDLPASGGTYWGVDLPDLANRTFSGLLVQAGAGGELTGMSLQLNTIRDGDTRWAHAPISEMVLVTRVLPVPEPSSWLLGVLGALILLGWARHRPPHQRGARLGSIC